VLEVPPASDKGVLYGQVVDAWQETIAAVGPSGEDKGKGGKYLFLPPGYDKPVPGGYIALRCQNFRIGFGFRSIRLPGMSDADAHTYAQRLKMYPFSEAANPKPTRFVDAWPDRLSTLPFYDFRYFQDLYDIVTHEPVRPRDKVMMGMLSSIGIERGKPFNPSPKIKAAMERAVVDAYFYMQDRINDGAVKQPLLAGAALAVFFHLRPRGGRHVGHAGRLVRRQTFRYVSPGHLLPEEDASAARDRISVRIG
jgi:hypothetical protein